MIITNNNIYNELNVELTTDNAFILDDGIEGYNARDEVIYIDFEVSELPVSLCIKLLNVSTRAVHLTTDKQEYCTIDLAQAKTQANPPEDWGKVASVNTVIADCQNQYGDHWPYILSEGLAIVPITTGYHIYYAALNMVHRSGLNWKFGGAFIIYPDAPRTIVMSDKVYLQNGIQINGALEIDHNGLYALPRLEMDTYQFWDERVLRTHHTRSVNGVRHDEWGVDDYFTFTNDLTALEKSLSIESMYYWSDYHWTWNSNATLQGSVTIGPNKVQEKSLTYKGSSSGTEWATFTSDSYGFVTKVQLGNYDGNNLAESAKITYTFKSLDYIKIVMASAKNVIFKNGSTEEEWLPSVKKTIIDTNNESWTAVYDEKGIMTVTPENRDLPATYQPTFLASYGIKNILTDVIPINSVPWITSWDFNGIVPEDCIGINSGNVKFYSKGTSATNLKIIAFIK